MIEGTYLSFCLSFFLSLMIDIESCLWPNVRLICCHRSTHQLIIQRFSNLFGNHILVSVGQASTLWHTRRSIYHPSDYSSAIPESIHALNVTFNRLQSSSNDTLFAQSIEDTINQTVHSSSSSNWLYHHSHNVYFVSTCCLI
jgi:hypothetical protein